jgi:hypothetical protein
MTPDIAPNEPTIEHEIALVEGWIREFSQTDKLPQGMLRPEGQASLRRVLTEFGANFELTILEHWSLAVYTNAGKAPGMRAVWGDEKFAEYKAWTKAWASDYEASGNKLPRLGKKPKAGEPDKRPVNSGMIALFGEITAFADGVMSADDLEKYLENRAQNGRLWQKGKRKKGDRVRVQVPTSDKPILLSSFPPGFPSAAWEHIKSWKSNSLSK